MSEKETAKMMIDALEDCHLGTAINSCHQKAMKFAYNINWVVAANAKAAKARAKLAIVEANRAFAVK